MRTTGWGGALFCGGLSLVLLGCGAKPQRMAPPAPIERGGVPVSERALPPAPSAAPAPAARAAAPMPADGLPPARTSDSSAGTPVASPGPAAAATAPPQPLAASPAVTSAAAPPRAVAAAPAAPPAAGSAAPQAVAYVPAPVPAVAPAAAPGKAVASLLARAEEQQRAGDLPGAAGSLERALRIEPRNALIWNRLAHVRAFQGRWDLAQQFASKSNSLLTDADTGLTRDNAALIAQAQAALR